MYIVHHSFSRGPKFCHFSHKNDLGEFIIRSWWNNLNEPQVSILNYKIKTVSTNMCRFSANATKFSTSSMILRGLFALILKNEWMKAPEDDCSFDEWYALTYLFSWEITCGWINWMGFLTFFITSFYQTGYLKTFYAVSAFL